MSSGEIWAMPVKEEESRPGSAVNGANGSGGGHQSVISLERSVKRAEVRLCRKRSRAVLEA